MPARRKARHASCEWKVDAGSSWKVEKALLHLHTNQCVHCTELCMWAPNLWERVCAPRCNATWGSSAWRRLPRSLAMLSFGDEFNQSLEQVTLPSRLQSLSFGLEFNQSLERVSLPSSLQSLIFYIFLLFVRPKPGAGDLVIEYSKLEFLFFGSTKAWSGWACHRVFKASFGDEFNQSLERVILPSSLQSLAFGDRFNQSLERVTLPSSLQSLSFGLELNQSLERVSWPSSLQSLIFCFSFDQSLEQVTLSSSIQSLSFFFLFNQSLERVSLPSSLQS